MAPSLLLMVRALGLTHAVLKLTYEHPESTPLRLVYRQIGQRLRLPQTSAFALVANGARLSDLDAPLARVLDQKNVVVVDVVLDCRANSELATLVPPVRGRRCRPLYETCSDIGENTMFMGVFAHEAQACGSWWTAAAVLRLTPENSAKLGVPCTERDGRLTLAQLFVMMLSMLDLDDPSERASIACWTQFVELHLMVETSSPGVCAYTYIFVLRSATCMRLFETISKVTTTAAAVWEPLAASLIAADGGFEFGDDECVSWYWGPGGVFVPYWAPEEEEEE